MVNRQEFHITENHEEIARMRTHFWQMLTNYISSYVYFFSGNSDQQKGEGYLLLSEVITLPEIPEAVGDS